MSPSETPQQHKSAATTVARRVPSTPPSLLQCGQRLRSGHLVAFPTETVYGLGCAALNPKAVTRVFEAKERPLSDPLIVHVTDVGEAMKLWEATSSLSEVEEVGKEKSSSIEAQTLQTLTAHFWPGPLTLVARSSPTVPPIVTAQTGFVACRSPAHPIARAVIDSAGIPIAAPSANKFGHVSPTRADHVMDDLGGEDVWVLDPGLVVGDGDGEDSGADAAAANGGVGGGGEEVRVCDVGVESTVAKIEMTPDNNSDIEGKVVVLRHGAISTSDIRRALDSAGLTSDIVQVVAVNRSTGEHVTNVAPGQTVRHYSPDLVSYMIGHSRYGQGMELDADEGEFLSRAVVIDLGGRLGALEELALAYRDLSVEDDSGEAAAAVFDALRWAEGVEGAERVYFPELVVAPPAAAAAASASGGVEGSGNGSGGSSFVVGEEDALTLAVKDRLARAASGIVIDTLQ